MERADSCPSHSIKVSLTTRLFEEDFCNNIASIICAHVRFSNGCHSRYNTQITFLFSENFFLVISIINHQKNNGVKFGCARPKRFSQKSCLNKLINRPTDFIHSSHMSPDDLLLIGRIFVLFTLRMDVGESRREDERLEKLEITLIPENKNRQPVVSPHERSSLSAESSPILQNVPIRPFDPFRRSPHSANDSNCTNTPTSTILALCQTTVPLQYLGHLHHRPETTGSGNYDLGVTFDHTLLLLDGETANYCGYLKLEYFSLGYGSGLL